MLINCRLFQFKIFWKNSCRKISGYGIGTPQKWVRWTRKTRYQVVWRRTNTWSQLTELKNSLWLACSTVRIVEVCYCTGYIIYISVQWIKSCISNIDILVFLSHVNMQMYMYSMNMSISQLTTFLLFGVLLNCSYTSISLHRLFPMKGILFFLSVAIAKSLFCLFMTLVKISFFL